MLFRYLHFYSDFPSWFVIFAVQRFLKFRRHHSCNSVDCVVQLCFFFLIFTCCRNFLFLLRSEFTFSHSCFEVIFSFLRSFYKIYLIICSDSVTVVAFASSCCSWIYIKQSFHRYVFPSDIIPIMLTDSSISKSRSSFSIFFKIHYSFRSNIQFSFNSF